MCTYNKKKLSILTLNSKINSYEMNLLFHKSLMSNFDVLNERKEQWYMTVCLNMLKDVNTYGVPHCILHFLRYLLI